MYKYINEFWQKIWKEKPESIKERAIAWRKEPAIVRVEKPSRIDKARRLGYKAKQGYIVVRVRVGRGGMRKSRPKAGRRPKHLGTVKIKANVNYREVAERRISERYPNLKVLNSYFLYKDGKYAWYEVILVDPNHPVIASEFKSFKT
ncbi:MAG: 50S ribosomal protein L15e [Nitrososphaerales archaeon]